MSGNIGMIKYGIGTTYLPDWSAKEALREIYQNFVDYGEYKESVVAMPNPDPGEESFCVLLSNEYVPASEGDFLKIGKSGKRGDGSTIGSHGEGLKMAAMILCREDYDFHIQCGGRRYTAAMYDDEFLGECFGFSVDSYPDLTEPFRVRFTVGKDDYDEWKKSLIKAEDAVYSCDAGSIVEGEPGDVYVGGFYVSNVRGLTKAYNFPPSVVPLDRDRRVPVEFDVVWAAGKVLSKWEGTTVQDLTTKDARYVQGVSDKLARKFKPSIDRGTGEVSFAAGDTRAPAHVAGILLGKPFVQKEVSKLRYEMSRKRKPHSVLKDFRDRHATSFPRGSAMSDFDVIMRKSKAWKN